MDKRGWDVWNNITFKTQGYRKNFDLATVNENIITEYTGNITLLRLKESKSPLVIGEYSFSVWDISLANILKIDLNKLLSAHHMVKAYVELVRMIKENEISINDYDKIVLIHSLAIHPDYRKLNILDEFVEFIYRDYHSDKTAIIAMVQPFQDNKYDFDYYINQKVVVGHDMVDYEPILAGDYYQLKAFIDKEDTEINEYKLFAIANRCGFNRIDESHLFLLDTDVTLERIKEKKSLQTNTDLWDTQEIT